MDKIEVMEILIVIYFSANFVFIAFMGGVALCLREVYILEKCLSDKTQFFRCLFQWEIFVWEGTENYLNNFGRGLLTVLSFIVCFPSNLLAFVALSVCEIIKLFVIGFLKIFGKKN